jgi:predicted acyl esterase
MRGAKLSLAVGIVLGLGGLSWAQTAPAPTTVPRVTAQVPAPPVDPEAAQKARLAEALKSYHGPEYVRSVVMIPARDGVLLHTVILRPVGSDKSGVALPFLMTRADSL